MSWSINEQQLRADINLANLLFWLRYGDPMPYCHHIAGECIAGGNALRCAKTECPAAPKEDDDEQSVQAV